MSRISKETSHADDILCKSCNEEMTKFVVIAKCRCGNLAHRLQDENGDLVWVQYK